MTTPPHAGVLVVVVVVDLRETIVHSLADEGYRSQGAANGKEALDRLRDGGPLPCLVLLDMMMPVMDGRAFRAEQLRDSRLSGIPVIVITAHADIHAVERDLETTGALRKPLSLEELFKAVELRCGKRTEPGWKGELPSLGAAGD